MSSFSTKIQFFSLLAIFSSLAVNASHVGEKASTFDARASGPTLPAIFKNATSQINILTQKMNGAIVYNTTLKAESSYVGSLLKEVGDVIDNTTAQANQTGKQPFDQISGGLTESDIQYLSGDFLTAVASSINAPQSVAGSYPELQKTIDQIEPKVVAMCGCFCIWWPWLCWFWWPWVYYLSTVLTRIGSAL